MARQFFSQSEAVGARISIDNGRNWLRIVGVVGDVRNALASQPSQTFYRPLAQAPLLTVMFLARTSGNAAGLAQQMRAAVHAIDAHQPVDQFRTLDEVRSASLSAPRLTATLIGVFAGIALLITAAGLAGVIAFSVNQRSQEFGVRMALGASRGSVLQLVLGQGLRLIAVGLVLGGVAALALSNTVRALLFDTEPTDIPTFVGVAAVLALVALLACFLPARRASSVDPLVVLRGN